MSVSALAQFVNAPSMPALNVAMSVHCPKMQALPPVQAVPHAPQLKTLLRRSTQLEAHWVWAPQSSTQVPPTQRCVLAQTTPQAPQFWRDPLTFTGRPAQSLITPPAANAWQLPFSQLVSAGQTLPGAPQFRSSEASETQLPSSITSPVGQLSTQLSPKHACPAAQTVSQPPQCEN
jgi:hypothetical protein